MIRAVPYLRTSTDDKQQDPLRQLHRIRPWAKREGIHLTDPIVDEGTSAYKVSPFKRPEFRRAVELAKHAHVNPGGITFQCDGDLAGGDA